MALGPSSSKDVPRSCRGRREGLAGDEGASKERDCMTQVVIENPIINSPFDEPTRHFRFTDEGITNEIVDGRRTSAYFVPIAPAKKKGGQKSLFETEWTQDRIEENRFVNDIRHRVDLWRKGGYLGVTPTTARLLAYWTDPNREKKLFFCQNEALETAIYITEVAKKYGDAWIENEIREANDTASPGSDLRRVSLVVAYIIGFLIHFRDDVVSRRRVVDRLMKAEPKANH